MDTFTDKRSGMQFCMKTRNPHADAVLEHGILEYNLIRWCEQYLSPDGVFVDIGAHIGTYSVLLSKHCKTVHAFEPQRDTFDCLTIGACLNNAFNIETYNLALGSKEGTATFYQIAEDGTSSTLRKELAATILKQETVQVKTLDSYNLKDVDFLKLAVEGYELEVLKGASMTLVDNNFPPFVFDARPDDWYKQDREALLAFVRGLGYKVFPISGTNNMYLASDHPLGVKRVKKEDESPKHDMEPLVKRYTEEEDLDLEWSEWHALANHFRHASKHVFAYDCGLKGLKADPPAEKEYLLQEEISIVSFYINKKPEGMQACEEVVLSKHAPWNTRNLALSNQAFYITPLPIKRKFPLTPTFPAKFTPSSTAIIQHGTGYRLNVRGVNYMIADKGHYIMRHDDNVVRTVNCLMEMDAQFKVVSQVDLVNTTGLPLYPKNVTGLEDIRLFGENYFLCTSMEVNASNVPQICFGTYQADGSITSLIPLMAGTELKCEKNWLPFIQDGTIYFIYALGPFQLYKLDPLIGHVEEVKRGQLGSRFIDDFRGSASPIPYKDGWLFTIHQVCHGEPRKYYHRLAWLSADFTTINYSRLFYFERVGIEYNLGLCHSPEGLLVTYSINDASPFFGIVDYDIVDEWLAHY